MDPNERERLAGMIATAIVKGFNEIMPVKNIPSFPAGDVPVRVAAAVYRKDAAYVRAGIIAGWLPIGRATRDGKLVTDINDMNSKKGRITYQISPLKLWEDTGFVWQGEQCAEDLEINQKPKICVNA